MVHEEMDVAHMVLRCSLMTNESFLSFIYLKQLEHDVKSSV